MRCPTIKIVSDNEQGFKIINESDFDESIHQRFIPTKEELLQEAKVLGVKVGGRSKPETIAKQIEEAKNTGLIEEDI